MYREDDEQSIFGLNGVVNMYLNNATNRAKQQSFRRTAKVIPEEEFNT